MVDLQSSRSMLPPGMRSGGAGLADERVRDLELREATEVTVGAPELAHPVLEAQRGDPRVVHTRTFDQAVQEQWLQALPVAGRFAQGRRLGDSSQASIWSMAPDTGVGGL